MDISLDAIPRDKDQAKTAVIDLAKWFWDYTFVYEPLNGIRDLLWQISMRFMILLGAILIAVFPFSYIVSVARIEIINTIFGWVNIAAIYILAFGTLLLITRGFAQYFRDRSLRR